MADTNPQTEEDRVRAALSDAIVVVRKFLPLCKSPQELVELCELALSNDAQLALVMERIGTLQLKK